MLMLVVCLGKKKYNDREYAVEDVKEVDFYRLYEFDAELPGTSQVSPIHPYTPYTPREEHSRTRWQQ